MSVLRIAVEWMVVYLLIEQCAWVVYSSIGEKRLCWPVKGLAQTIVEGAPDGVSGLGLSLVIITLLFFVVVLWPLPLGMSVWGDVRLRRR